MKLVKNSPIWATIQGEGVLVGVPTLFLRLWGCDFSCAFCDTKDSWRPGSAYVERTSEDVAREINTYPHEWLSITGGNPVLQGDELVKVLSATSKRVLLETQASVVHRELFAKVHFFSLSPKLHDWRWNILEETIAAASWVSAKVQFKVVVSNEAEALDVILRFERLHQMCEEAELDSVTFILLPEFGAGRKGVQGAIKAAQEAQGKIGFDLRVIPQMHKLALFVP